MADARAKSAEKPPASTDSDLISAFHNAGDRTALDTLVRRHIGRVRAVIYQMVLDDNVADDLTQDVFIRALRGLPSFRQDSELSTWLYTIAMNCVRSYLSRRKPSTVAIDVNLNISTNEFPADAVASKELDESIQQAMEQLSPILRSAMVLIVINGLSAAEAAAIEDCAVATMHSRLHEARKQLKRLLARYLS